MVPVNIVGNKRESTAVRQPAKARAPKKITELHQFSFRLQSNARMCAARVRAKRLGERWVGHTAYKRGVPICVHLCPLAALALAQWVRG